MWLRNRNARGLQTRANITMIPTLPELTAALTALTEALNAMGGPEAIRRSEPSAPTARESISNAMGQVAASIGIILAIPTIIQ